MSKKTNRKEAEPQAEQPQQQGLSIPQALAQAHHHWKAGQSAQAEALCQKVLQVWPGNPDALHQLGLIAYNWNNLDLALDYVRKACLSPAAPASYFSNLAEMCRQRQLLTEGEIAGRRAVALDPAMVGAWNNLGIVLQELGKYEESLICLERVVALNPNYAEAHNNLGNTFKRLGRPEKAEACYMNAIALAPNYAEAHSNLSNLLKDAGEYARAIEEARRAIELSPRAADAYINLAAVEMARNQHTLALQWVEALLAFAPTNAMALGIKADALEKLDKTAESLEVARRAVVLAPESADAHNALGHALQSSGLYEEAIASYEKAHTLHSLTPEQSHINKATLLMEINRNEEALAVLETARAVNPKSANIAYNLHTLKTFEANDPDIAQMEKLLASLDKRNTMDRILMHFSLGKAYKDTGDTPKSFAHYDEGNRMKRATISYDAPSTDLWVREIISTFTPQLMERYKDQGHTSQLPVFVIGMPRSGTTLIEQVLASHPKVHGAGELNTMQHIVSGARGVRPLAYPNGMNELPTGYLTSVGEAYLGRITPLVQGHTRVVDKMPANFFYAGLIALAFPQARIIHSMRDPVDTCLSCYTNLFAAEQNFSYNQTEAGQFYRAYLTMMEHWRSVLPKERFIEVQYEDMVGDFETQARRIVDFCGLEWNDACLEFYKGNRRVRTASMQQVRKPIYKSSVGKWKKYAPQLEQLLNALGISAPEPTA